MTGMEIILILTGLVLMVGSFMMTEKLSGKDLDQIAELSQKEIKRILEKKLAEAENSIEEQIDTAIDDSMNKVERGLDRETNEKMQAISEYSDTVLENMNKTHNEIMFLYSMLNDKHTELTELSEELGRQVSETKQNIQENAAEPQPEEAEVKSETEEATGGEDAEAFNHNDRILELYKQGQSFVEIAKNLGLGTGEVKLVVGLFKGDEESEV